jgi:hypothetical protein
MPVSSTPALAGGVTLKKSFRSPLMQRRIYAKQRQAGRATHTEISRAGDTLPKCKVSSQSVQSHPRSGQIGSHLFRDGLAFARVQPTGFGRDTPYSSSKRGFCVRAMDAVKPQSGRSNGRADVRSHGQAVTSPRPQTCPRRVQSVTLTSPKP